MGRGVFIYWCCYCVVVFTENIAKREVHTVEPTLLCTLQRTGGIPETGLQKSEQEFMPLLVLFGFHLVYMCVFLEIFIGG